MSGETETPGDAPTVGEETDHDASTASAAVSQPSSRRLFKTIVGRELRTVARTRTFFILALAFAAVVLGIAWSGGGVRAGYVPTLVDLLTPLELLVPIVAIAFGYRAILSDEERGELDVLETYPVTNRQFVLGVYAGRAIGLLAVVVVPLAIVAIMIGLFEAEELWIYATHSGADSPILFAHFLVLTALFALVVLAVAIAISAVVSGTRSALALSVVALVVLLIGLDLLLVYGFSVGVIGDGMLVHSLAISPLSAYRGLVFETAVIVAAGTGPAVASPIASVVGLVGWFSASLAIATWALNR